MIPVIDEKTANTPNASGVKYRVRMGVATMVMSAPIDDPPITMRVFKTNEFVTINFFGGLPDSDCKLIQKPVPHSFCIMIIKKGIVTRLCSSITKKWSKDDMDRSDCCAKKLFLFKKIFLFSVFIVLSFIFLFLPVLIPENFLYRIFSNF